MDGPAGHPPPPNTNTSPPPPPTHTLNPNPQNKETPAPHHAPPLRAHTGTEPLRLGAFRWGSQAHWIASESPENYKGTS